MMYADLLATGGGWVLDVAFFVILILGTVLGTHRGFVDGVCKLVGKITSIVLAVTFCIAFANFLELCFHMTTGITNGLAGAFAKNEELAATLPAFTGETMDAVLKSSGVTGIAHWFIVSFFKAPETIFVGVTAAQLIASILAKWISIAIAFILLIILVRLAARLLSKALTALVDHISPLRVINRALGAVLGLIKACVLIFILLLICNWLPIGGLHAYLESSAIIGSIFRAEWFQAATSYAVSGAWFTEYISGIIK